jgi:hypothetical protein
MARRGVSQRHDRVPMTTRVVCLCCAREYDADGECTNVDVEHGVERATEVARYLRDRGCEHPRPLDVKTAIAALDAMSRG